MFWNSSMATVAAARSGDYVEMSIELADIGAGAHPTALDVHISMVNDGGGGDWTFAGVPSTSFTDGLDPDYGQYFAFALGGPVAPNDHTALP